MAEKSKIQWTDDTHNFWQGCTKVSDGCKNCYAEARDKRFTGGKLWGVGAERQRSASFNKPLTWNKKPWVCDECGSSEMRYDLNSILWCDGCGDYVTFHRRRVFSLSLGDWMDNEVPIKYLADMLKVIHDCPNLDFLLLTKRPENWFERIHEAFIFIANNRKEDYRTLNWLSAWMGTEHCCEPGEPGEAPSNIWLGTSVENQAMADKRIPELLKIPAKVRFLSCEPLLGGVDFKAVNALEKVGGWKNYPVGGGIHWVIVGGESGANARPCNIEWIRSIVARCQAAGVACFVKQLGADPVPQVDDPFTLLSLKDKKGGDISEWPEDLRVREFPNL